MATEQQIPVLMGKMVEYQKNFSVLPTEVAQWVINHTEEAIGVCSQALTDYFKKVKEAKQILRLISGGQTIRLKALDGTRLIYKARETFKGHIDSDFKNWGLAKKGVATPETLIQIHEMVGDGTFMDIFRSLPGTWNQKWLSQDQLIEFCQSFPDWLRPDGYGTFVLLKKDENKVIDENNPAENLVAASVHVHSGGLLARVRQLGRDDLWHAEYRHRAVVPQLIP